MKVSFKGIASLFYKLKTEWDAIVAAIKLYFDKVLTNRHFIKDWAIKQIPFILFVMFLSLVYINNIYTYNILLKELYNKKEELKVMRIESIELETRLKSDGKNTAVYNKLEEVNSSLEVITEPIIVVE